MPRLFLTALVVLASCSQPTVDQQKAAPDEAPPKAPEPVPTAPPPAPPPPVPAGSPELVAPPAALAGKLSLVKVMDGFSRPVAIEVAPGDGSGRLFVVEQVGRIWTVTGGARSDKPIYDIRRRVSRANEQGLLGLAFHPEFAKSRKLYVNFTDKDGATNVVEYQLGPSGVDMSTAREVFKVRQPFSNHNAGDLEFGPDGKLWIGLGDGGAGGDPIGAGQSDKNVLGKMLRIDVDDPSAQREIVIKGVRNPWRYAFDPKTGDLYIADVGQNEWEEVDVVPRDRWTGLNLGWNIKEASHCFKPRSGCSSDGLVDPVVEYSHKEGCSITGGEVYRGKAIPELDGAYFYADYCAPNILRSFRWSAAGGVRDHWDWTAVLNDGPRVKEISSFGVDHDGELYVVSLLGSIYKLVTK